MTLSATDNEISNCISVLKKGGLILYPTDTVWGIGCDATNKEAVKKVNELKSRSSNKALIILLDNDSRLNKYVKNVPEMAWDLIDYSTKPITIIYPEVRYVAPDILAADGSAGIRITKDPFCMQLIHKFGKPVVSTSANISNRTAPQIFDEIDKHILSGVDYVVNLHRNRNNNTGESTVIKLEVDGTIKIIRK
jgi:L-threonylcarbamoyladenylate synthase